eukprot:3560182-Alexandrium_andersonii.AAC.1
MRHAPLSGSHASSGRAETLALTIASFALLSVHIATDSPNAFGRLSAIISRASPLASGNEIAGGLWASDRWAVAVDGDI